MISAEQYQYSLRRVSDLFYRVQRLDADEDAEMERMIQGIEEYEAEHYPFEYEPNTVS